MFLRYRLQRQMAGLRLRSILRELEQKPAENNHRSQEYRQKKDIGRRNNTPTA
jgi:hypothetical protein